MNLTLSKTTEEVAWYSRTITLVQTYHTAAANFMEWTGLSTCLMQTCEKCMDGTNMNCRSFVLWTSSEVQGWKNRQRNRLGNWSTCTTKWFPRTSATCLFGFHYARPPELIVSFKSFVTMALHAGNATISCDPDFATSCSLCVCVCREGQVLIILVLTAWSRDPVGKQ